MKVGEKWKLRSDLQLYESYGYIPWNKYMESSNIKGNIVTIIEIDKNDNTCKIEGYDNWFSCDMFDCKVSAYTINKTSTTDETINKLNGKIDMLLGLLGCTTLEEVELQYNEKYEIDLFSKDDVEEIALIDDYTESVCNGKQCCECIIEKIKCKLDIHYVTCDVMATLLYLKKFNKLK